MFRKTKSWINNILHLSKFLGILQRSLSCIKERRTPVITKKIIYIAEFRIKTAIYNWQKQKKTEKSSQKYLYASAVNQEGKKYLSKIIHRFGHQDFDYLIFVYDNAQFKEEIYKDCVFIHEKGIKWQFAKRYLTPEYCKEYNYIFIWDDDIDIEDFSYRDFIEIMERNNLEIAQPALSYKSYPTKRITLKNEKYRIGRYVDYVENMIPVFTREAWFKYWTMMEKDYNFWGWGYNALAKSFCGYKNMGIVDCETVRHTRPAQSKYGIAPKEGKIFLEKYKRYKKAMGLTYAKLR